VLLLARFLLLLPLVMSLVFMMLCPLLLLLLGSVLGPFPLRLIRSMGLLRFVFVLFPAVPELKIPEVLMIMFGLVAFATSSCVILCYANLVCVGLGTSAIGIKVAAKRLVRCVLLWKLLCRPTCLFRSVLGHVLTVTKDCRHLIGGPWINLGMLN
jgi:hypothetical protein